MQRRALIEASAASATHVVLTVSDIVGLDKLELTLAGGAAGLGRSVELRRQLRQHVGRTAAVPGRDERRGVHAVPVREQPPVAHDDLRRVDQRAVHVRENALQAARHRSSSSDAAGSAATDDDTATVSPVSSS